MQDLKQKKNNIMRIPYHSSYFWSGFLKLCAFFIVFSKGTKYSKQTAPRHQIGCFVIETIKEALSIKIHFD